MTTNPSSPDHQPSPYEPSVRVHRPSSNFQIPLSDLTLGPEEEAAILRVLHSQWLTMGAETQQFEAEFAAYTNAPHAIAVANGTAALHLAGLALGWGPGDEIILPSLTFVATANAVRYTGATPIFADIVGPHDFSIDPAHVAAQITPRTRAIIVVHYAGYPCDMPTLLELAHRHNLAIVEDAAHAPGAHLHHRCLGTWGDIGCFSFFSNKNMTTGEGGMLLTPHQQLAEKLRLLRSHGMTTLTWDRHHGHAFSYDVIAPGYNYRIDEIRAALGRVQLQKLPANNEARRRLTHLYHQYLAELAPTVAIPYQNHPGQPSHHIMPILLPPGAERHTFMDHLKKQGIQTSIHYPPIHKFQYYRESDLGHTTLPKTEDIAVRQVTLPLYPTLTENEIQKISQTIQTALT